MPRTLLARFVALSVAAIGASTVAIAASPPASSSEEVYTVRKEGKDLRQAKKENDEALEAKEKELPQKQIDDANLKTAEVTRKKYVVDFNQRCARDFVKGEEAVMAACQ